MPLLLTFQAVPLPPPRSLQQKEQPPYATLKHAFRLKVTIMPVAFLARRMGGAPPHPRRDGVAKRSTNLRAFGYLCRASEGPGRQQKAERAGAQFRHNILMAQR